MLPINKQLATTVAALGLAGAYFSFRNAQECMSDNAMAQDRETATRHIEKGLDDFAKGSPFIFDSDQCDDMTCIDDINSAAPFFLHVANPENNSSGARSYYIQWHKVALKNAKTDAQRKALKLAAPNPNAMDKTWPWLADINHKLIVPNWKSSKLRQKFRKLIVHPLHDRAIVAPLQKINNEFDISIIHFGGNKYYAPSSLDLRLGNYFSKQLRNGTPDNIRNFVAASFGNEAHSLTRAHDPSTIYFTHKYILEAYSRLRKDIANDTLRFSKDPDYNTAAIWGCIGALLLIGAATTFCIKRPKTVHFSKNLYDKENGKIGFYLYANTICFLRSKQDFCLIDHRSSSLPYNRNTICELPDPDVNLNQEASEYYSKIRPQLSQPFTFVEALLKSHIVDIATFSESISGEHELYRRIYKMMISAYAQKFSDNGRSPVDLIDFLNKSGKSLEDEVVARMMLFVLGKNPIADIISNKRVVDRIQANEDALEFLEGLRIKLNMETLSPSLYDCTKGRFADDYAYITARTGLAVYRVLNSVTSKIHTMIDDIVKLVDVPPEFNKHFEDQQILCVKEEVLEKIKRIKEQQEKVVNERDFGDFQKNVQCFLDSLPNNDYFNIQKEALSQLLNEYQDLLLQFTTILENLNTSNNSAIDRLSQASTSGCESSIALNCC